MYFRVNGVALLSRGANLIPFDPRESQWTAAKVRRLIDSAVGDGGTGTRTGTNTLRVWGGGVFYPQILYDLCDDMGILLYHDMQYVQQYGHGPVDQPASDSVHQLSSPDSAPVSVPNEATQTAELRHQIRRLSAHPSIVI